MPTNRNFPFQHSLVVPYVASVRNADTLNTSMTVSAENYSAMCGLLRFIDQWKKNKFTKKINNDSLFSAASPRLGPGAPLSPTPPLAPCTGSQRPPWVRQTGLGSRTGPSEIKLNMIRFISFNNHRWPFLNVRVWQLEDAKVKKN